MRQLTSLDAQFLAVEAPRQPAHVAGLAILDASTAPGGALTVASVEAMITARLPLLPPLRWRLVEVPFDLDHPYWVDDDDFDLDFHVREVALPSPGTDEQLADQIARLHARPLDRARPLWELYVISGLASGHVGVYIKVHHALIDGVSGAELTGLLLDVTPEVARLDVPDRAAAGRTPGSIELTLRAALAVPRYPLRVARALPAALPYLDETMARAVPGLSALGRLAGRVHSRVTGTPREHVRSGLTAPPTPFSGRLSQHRRFAFGSLPLSRLKAVKAAYGVTLNDVVVTMCAGAVRRWLVAHEALPATPLVAQIPVSVRTSSQAGTYGNRILLLGAALHTEIADPVQRLHETAADLSEMKGRHKALPAQLLQDVNDFIPPAVFARASRTALGLTSRLSRPLWNLVVSNVPGPQIPLYLAGARMVANYPVSVITDGMGLNITVMSYDGSLDIGVIADRDQVPDVWDLVGYLDDALTELEERAPGLVSIDLRDPAPAGSAG